MYKNVIFDADGTLLNTFSGIKSSIDYATDKLGKQRIDTQTLHKFVGPSLFDSFTNTVGYDSATAVRGIEFYREHYSVTGAFDCELYDGIVDTLKNLKSAGVILSVATSKPQRFIDIILKDKGLYDYFDIVCGSSESDDHSDKSAIVKKAMCNDSAIMVGDRHYDINGAKAVGIDSIGVEWGFCEKDEFITYPPTYIVTTPNEICDIVIK